MKKILLTITNYLIFLFFTLFLTTVQISIWPQLLNETPPPQFWIVTLAYWLISRRALECLIMVYLLSFLIGGLSTMPISLILIINIILFCSGSLLKQKIYWSDSVYLMILSGLGCLFFPFVHLAISWPLEANPIYLPEIFRWMISSVLSVSLSPALFRLFGFLDKMTHKKDVSPEVWPGIL